MGKFLNKKLAIYLVMNRIFLLAGVYFLVISKSLSKSLQLRSFFEFLKLFGVRWDGNSYTFIASHGYVLTGVEKNFLVFPPFYPLLIKIVSLISIDPVVAGVLISNTFFILSMLVFYKLLRLDYSKRFSMLTVVFVSIFPTSFFFSVAYPEALFFFLFALSFYLARKRNYLYAGGIAGLAAITRPFGIILAPALFVQLIQNKDLNLKNLLSLTIPFALPPFYYLLINYLLFQNPFQFMVFLKTNWQKTFDFPWNGIISSWKRGIQTLNNFSYKYFVGYGEAIASTFAWISIIFGIKNWGVKSSYLAYLMLGTILFTSTSFILSAPRYLLSIPPFFIIFSGIIGKNKFVTIAWTIISTILLFYISYEFAWGHWTF